MSNVHQNGLCYTTTGPHLSVASTVEVTKAIGQGMRDKTSLVWGLTQETVQTCHLWAKFVILNEIKLMSSHT